jgi:hypothetical protein
MNAYRSLAIFGAVLGSLVAVAAAQPPVTGPATVPPAADAAKTLQDRVDQLEQEVVELRASLLNLQNQLSEKDAELQEIVQALSRRDSNRQPILALRNIMKNSDEFRQEMQQAVNDSIQREGELRIDNQTSGVQFLSINGTTQRVDALRVTTFKVPVGTLTTELVGQESSKNWTVGPPAYRQEIIIRPRTVQSVVVERPIYLLP